MSEQADGLKPSDDSQLEEEGHGMHSSSYNNKPLDKPNSHTFVTSKSNYSSNTIIHHAHPNSHFIDDDLVSWLQYPLDDGIACHDMFHHWPPPPLPSPPHFSPSPVLKDLPPLHNDALMVDALDIPADSRISVKNDQKPNAEHLKQVSHSDCKMTQEVSNSDGRMKQEVLKPRAGGEAAQLHDSLFRHVNEVASAALGAALQQVGDGERECVAKDSRKLSQRKLLPQEDERERAAGEAHLVTNADTHSRHSEKRKVAAGENPDSNWARTSELRHPPQHEGLPAHHNVVGSSSGNTLQKESSVNSLCRKDKSLLDKDLSRKLSATTDSIKANINVQANPAADAALALGAGRAAGVIRPSGMEAFSKVRTSLQPIPPSKLGSPPAVYPLSPTSPSGKYTSYPTGYSPPVSTPRGRAFGVHDFTLSTQPVQEMPHNAVQPHWFRPCANIPSMGMQEHQLVRPLIRGDNNSSKNSHMESSTTALLASQGTEKLSVGLKQGPCTEQAKDIGVGSSAAAASGFSLQYRDKKDDVVFSGGSETSESLKETFSGSKRKLEDSECQSEDAEAESAVNSQARGSSSKRTRANEVHNLSERRRRNRINDKMNALRELIPNATKSNKAALLDEAIDYLKNLQLQLQVMSMRTGVTLSPMVLPPGLPHMQMPICPTGIGTSGGCSSATGLGGAGSTVGVAMCDMTYGVPAGPLTSLASSDPMMLQPSANSANTEPQVTESVSSQFPYPFLHASSQPIFSVNMDMYNIYLQQQQLQQQLHRQEQLASPQAQASSQQPPPSQQQSQYQL